MAKQIENACYLRAHDDVWLIKRWRALAREAGWKMRAFAKAGGTPVYYVAAEAECSEPRLYLSAGIHGDEPAAPEALLAWCGKRRRALASCGALIFPCLNPWGLRHNIRVDKEGRDLNRSYRRRDVPVLEAQKEVVGSRTFDAAIMLHEDFDARGLYIYEIPGERPLWGEELIAAGTRHVPPDPRTRIEGRRCQGGVIRARVTPETMPDHPEAFFLRFGHTDRSLTIETPSEFSLRARVAAHGAVLDEVLRLLTCAK